MYRISGSDTISMSPVPALLRSIWVTGLLGLDVDFAVSYDRVSKPIFVIKNKNKLVPVEFALCEH